MQNPKPDTDELLRRASQSDADAKRALFERHRGRLAKMVELRMDPRLRARLDPSDIVQETLTTANEKMDTYLANEPLPFYPWLRQIAWEKLVHEHDRHLRAAKRSVAREDVFRPEISDASVMGLAELVIGRTSSPSAGALRQELKERLRQALDSLVEADREVLLMRYLEQLSSREIAAITGVSEEAVNMRHMRALKRLRKILSPHESEL